jgi:N-methylhydantoinase A
VRIGVDSGGTFTDVIAIDDAGALRTAKLPSTRDPAEAVLAGIAAVGGRGGDAAVEVVHGTTVATNALVERRGGPTALVTTAGFEDLLALRRHARPRLYALHPVVSEPLSPEALRFGLDERTAADGSVVRALDEDALDALADRLREGVARGEVRSIAVALLHATTRPAHERRVGARLAELGVPVSLSSEVAAEPREYERTATTVVDAYVAPSIGAYLERLRAALPHLRVMQSSGASASARAIAARPVRTILSGPAAGVVGARAIAAACNVSRAITFDMGGTSTDVALLDGKLVAEAGEEDALVADHPLCVPSLRVHSVGAGGGSIAWTDARAGEASTLKVGPRSAGARPGPACYGAGGVEPTLTDAALLLGRIDPGRFLGGAIRLDAAAAGSAVSSLASSLGIDLASTAAGIARVATVTAARAIRVVSSERGHDPRDFTLVAFGGAGAMFACDVADELEMARALVPPSPGLLCAWGALAAGVARDFSSTRIAIVPAGASAVDLAADLTPLEAAAAAALDEEGVPPERRRLVRLCALRYRGQSHELEIELPDPRSPGASSFDVTSAFHALHARVSGFADRGRAVERVALRVEGRGDPEPLPPLSTSIEAGDPVVGALQPLGGPPGAIRVLARRRLAPGAVTSGPALIVEDSATTFVAPGWRATVHDGGALLLERR